MDIFSARVIVPENGDNRLASSLTSVDLPLPLAPSNAMRSSLSIRRVTRFSTGCFGS